MRKVLIYTTVVLLLSSCGGKKKTSTPTNVTPLKATLSSPAQNEACTTGTSVSSTESTVQFTWTAASNAESYDLNIKNLLNNAIITRTVTTTAAQVNLLKDTPYSWYVVSKSTKTTTTAESDTWKFYNAGTGKTSYAPFPAEILSPTYNQAVTASSGKITLDWNGTDADNDIVNYDIYLGTTTTPTLLQGTITASILNNVAVSSATTYYWKVISRDSKGNTSDSGLYRFSVN